ncbi:uncharacterized protein BDR25DRAFT_297789 [Lindgomyces ingoldianus]|uniref:Uncharacterized protein n=1 Tax=Lindgomyces ingoldianus TaxID=673940 RepID=A0ACB6Q9R6_9PLEO|nr:uncharacterized protein BDR25DRAFT_297789 [Lindgomyces ingoldianus]KAF2463652.1 hypothetical protein BDR25DRAFT_297789 [Lindgomyces ingoldianus]
MRVTLWLPCIVTHVWTVNANVEKTIFLAPGPAALPNVPPALDDLRLDTLEPAYSPVLETKLAVQFPAAAPPRGLESWYLLRGLDEGRRYEVRICWPATQPTDFWLDTYPITHVFNTPELLSSLATYTQQRQELGLETTGVLKEHLPSQSQSALFLRIQAAASFYSSNRTLMEHPPAVDADIILDPYILNIFPRSLGPVAIYIGVVAVAAWFLSGYIYRCLLSIAAEPSPRPHTD